MKRLFVLTLILMLLCALPVRAADAAYYFETALPDGSRIAYTQREAIPTPHGVAYQYDKCGVLAADGTFLVEPVYQSIAAPAEGRALFCKAGEGYGYFDENWNVVIPARYASAQSFSEGLAAVSDSQRTVGYIDRDGHTAIPFRYSSGGMFHNGLAEVGLAEEGYNFNTFTRTGTIDRQGNAVEPLAFRYEQDTFDVLLSENRIDINGTVYENGALRYPFINYVGYSYIPLTYGTCRALGFSCDWSAENGLVLTSTPDWREPELGGNTMKHGVYAKAKLYDGTLTIDGKAYTANDFYYPLLSYRDVVYLPVLYREGMERLGIRYSYHLGEGDATPGYMVFDRAALPAV